MWTENAIAWTTTIPDEIRNELFKLKTENNDKKPKYADFTNTKIDVDGGRGKYSPYTSSNEGTDFLKDAYTINGETGEMHVFGYLIDHAGNPYTQKGDSKAYISPTAAVADPSISEDAHDMSRYYDPETVAYVASNPALRAIGLNKNDHAKIEVRDEKGNLIKTVEAIVGDYRGSQAIGGLELSPEAARQTVLPGHQPYIFRVPKGINRATGKPFQNPKYQGGQDNVHLRVYKVSIINPKNHKKCVYYVYYWV